MQGNSPINHGETHPNRDSFEDYLFQGLQSFLPDNMILNKTQISETISNRLITELFPIFQQLNKIPTLPQS